MQVWRPKTTIKTSVTTKVLCSGVIWHVAPQQKIVSFIFHDLHYQLHCSMCSLRNEPHYPACISVPPCFTFVSAVQMSTPVSVLLGRVCKAGPRLHGEAGVSDMHRWNLWQASPWTIGGGRKGKWRWTGPADERGVRLDPHFCDIPSVPQYFSCLWRLQLKLSRGNISQMYLKEYAMFWDKSVHACEHVGLMIICGLTSLSVCDDILYNQEKCPRLISVITWPLKAVFVNWRDY